MARFKLLHGIHQQKDNDEKSPTFGSPKTYKRGDVFESEVDLEARHGREKFQNLDKLTSEDSSALKRRILQLEKQLKELLAGKAADATPEDTAPTPGTVVPDGEKEPDNMADFLPEDLDSMNLEDIRNLANELGIDLGGATKKADVIKAIRKGAAEMAVGV